MRFFKSIGWKIAIWHSIIFMFILSLFSGLLYMIFSDSLTDEVDSMLARKGDMIAYCIERGRPSSEIENYMNGLPVSSGIEKEEMYWQVEDGQGNVIAASQNLHGERISVSETLEKTENRIIRWDPELNGIPLRAMSLPLITHQKTTYRITVAANDRIKHFAIEQLRNMTIFCVIGFLGIAIVMGWLVSRKTLQPIQTIITAANQMTATSLHERLPIEGPEDELQMLAKTMNGMIDRLEVSFARIQQFTSDVSHELRTSLTIMRGEVDVALSKDRTAEEYRQVLLSVLEEVIYLSDMVEKFLSMSTETSNAKQITLKAIDGNAMFDYLRNRFLPMIENKRMELHVRTAESLILHGDEDLLRSLFVNLIENAIKYTPEGGTVVIHAKNKGEFAQIQVMDNGIGIPEQHVPFIFERFYRVDDSRTRSQGGTGLGLSLCKWIAEVHKGTIEVHSKPEQGTTVTVSL
ncbi:ATP-binding protein [Paenibacillus montanisoli]|uniref:histidine kinase n=1 Tax=Paenibacillus montanisoli TaxID=2081970 RepID=A0A328U5D9_9BACL|nr:ATP-binding protein [Paenibacillus montanisoli]RAP77292.1 two-component sensor histidine kinase [Paenibacillus montanisoli]